MNQQLLSAILDSTNEILASAIVIIAASLLLYNLTRNFANRVTRNAAIVLGCVTLVFTCDVFLSLLPQPDIATAVIRLQWVGIVFIPTALYHLSDALLATTRLPSRGRRRLAIRILYGVSLVFLLLAIGTDWLIELYMTADGTTSFTGNLMLPVFIAFYIIICAAAFNNVNRARRRCLTRGTRRRMTYLLAAILTPAFGVFPYSLLFPPAVDIAAVPVLVLVNLTNIVVLLMLLFLSYPLSFFGSEKPDRVVKLELLRFQLRGPGTGMLALAVIVLTKRASEIFGLAGEDITSFAVVAFVLLWQWSIHLALPYLERWLIYNGQSETLVRLQTLGERVLTEDDLVQLAEASLEALCDRLRSPFAVVVATDYMLQSAADPVADPVADPSSMSNWRVVAHVGPAVQDGMMLQLVGQLTEDIRPTGTTGGYVARNDELVVVDRATITGALQNLAVSGDAMTIPASTTGRDLSDDHTENGSSAVTIVATIETIAAATPQLLLYPLTMPPAEADQSPIEQLGWLAVSLRETDDPVDDETMELLDEYGGRITQALYDLTLQQEVFAALEGLLPRFYMNRANAQQIEYLPGYSTPLASQLPDRADVYEWVRAALRQYWGGEGISESPMLMWRLVQDEIDDQTTPVQALQQVVVQGLEQLKPTGEASLTNPEWTLYNILKLRFFDGKKVADVSRIMIMSQPDLYRKQRHAIQVLADNLLEREAQRVGMAQQE